MECSSFVDNNIPIFVNLFVYFVLYFKSLKILFRAYSFIIRSITRSLIIFNKSRKMTNDFFNHYIFVRTFQWKSSECLTNVIITVKVAMVTYIHCENGSLNLTPEAYLETCKHLRQSFVREKFTADTVN